MTFQIYWSDDFTQHRGYTIFDIEYYLTKSDYNDNYYSEIKVLPCVEGLTRYLNSRKNDVNFNLEEFIKDGNEIQELRRWLWEKADNNDETQHYKTRLQHIKNILNNFTKKYNVYLNID